MRFTCDTNELNTALSIVSRALAVRSTKPILEGILFESCDEGLRLTCTDLALGIETLLPATFSEEGRAVLPGKLLCEIIRKLPGGPCDITVGERMQATIRCASIRTTINGFDPVEYPELPQVEGASFELPQNTLKDMVGRTLFAIAQDESRPILTGCLMEISQTEMRVVALDGYRLALRKENVVGPAEPISAVVGGRVLGDIAKILADTEENVSLCFTRSHVRMNIGQTRVVARLLEGEFIRYRQILPEEWQTRVTVDRAELGSAIDRASLIAREGAAGLFLHAGHAGARGGAFSVYNARRTHDAHRREHRPRGGGGRARACLRRGAQTDFRHIVHALGAAEYRLRCAGYGGKSNACRSADASHGQRRGRCAHAAKHAEAARLFKRRGRREIWRGDAGSG